MPGAKADLIMVDRAKQTRVTDTSLITVAAPIARLSHGEVFQGRISRTWLSGQTIWDGAPSGPASGHFVTPDGLR